MSAQENQEFAGQTDRLFRAIGYVVISFQLLELWVAEALGKSLGMDAKDDRHLVSAAMGYKQKVDLLFELYARHGSPNPKVAVETIKASMLKAEEFRNRVVHSVWAVNTHGDFKFWNRTKASIKGKNGFNLVSRPVQIDLLERGAQAMNQIRSWEFCGENDLFKAIQDLSS